jgi:Zn finger protein HypA/HybF involved in hydrogenase expression
MGHGITVECNSCNYMRNYLLGKGFMYASLKKVIHLVSPQRREKVLDILDNEDIHEVTCQHELFQCPKCQHLESRFNFSIKYNEHNKYEPYFRCPECRSKLIILKEPIEEITCPKCGRKDLTQSTFMFWD